MPRCDFNKVAKHFSLRHECSPANSVHIFIKHFSKNTSGRLLLYLGYKERDRRL